MKESTFKLSQESADNYDNYLGAFLFEPYAIDIASRIQPENLKNILEIACGTGRTTYHLRKQLSSSTKIIATDISSEMLAVAKRRNNNVAIDFKIADIQNLPFKNNFFDCVVCQFGMMFLSDIQKGFNEVSRVLKPGGKFIFNTWNAAENIPVIDAVFNKVLRPFLPIETYRQLLIPFSIYDSQKIIEYMNAASFKNVVVNNVSLISSSSSAKEIVNGFLLKHPLGKKIAQKNALLLSKIANQMEHEIGEQFGYDPAFCQLSAFVIEGEKPGLI